MNRPDAAERWKNALGLDDAPIALAFVDRPPEGIERSADPAPSACTFWRRAKQGVLYAEAPEHENCPIGLMTMGFPLSPEQGQRAQALVGTMAQLHYFDPGEVAHVPTIKKPHRGIVYGPLGAMPVDPDLILLMLTPYQSMLAAEALGQVAWAESPQLGTFGRPACAALPKAEAIGGPTLSLGCVGARTYVDLPQEKLVLVVPRASFEAATDHLAGVVDANGKLEGFHKQQRASVGGT